jgi:phosphatidylserine decarboxylase
MPPEITSIQPGGGFCMSCELAWGRLRRRYLRRFRSGYVERLRQTRQGNAGTYPHEILDPRDVKFYRNQGDIQWRDEDDPFAWRSRLRVARAGGAEIVIIGGGFLLLAASALWLYWPAAVIPLVFAAFVVYFFRDPPRSIPTQPGVVVSPADGQVFSIREVDHDDYLGGPAVVIDIFLSVFNVHLNCVPMECRVIGLTYRRGKFLNALRPAASQENESLELRLETTAGPVRGLRVRQIAGAIARRIVCWVRPGEHLPRGGQFGMIKLGSRTELTLPQEPGLEIRVRQGQKVQAGTTMMAQYTGDAQR